MSVSIEHWRRAIGSFRGGRSGATCTTKFAANQSQKRSSGCLAIVSFLLTLLLSTLLLSGWSQLPTFGSTSSRNTTSAVHLSHGVTSWQTPVINNHLGSDYSLQQDHSFTSRLSRKKLNKLARAITGNRSNRGIKLAHWNAGSAHLCNKIDEIEQVVADLHPHVLGISEANFKKSHSLDDVQIQDYDIVLSKTLENERLGVSRVVCYKHQSLVGKVREDLMDDKFSSIWLELGLPRKKKFLVCQLYREWQYLGQADTSSRSIPEQLARWTIFLDQWQRALAGGKEVIVMGDFNLNHFKFTDAGQLQPLVDLLIADIYPHGVHQCVQGATHSWPGQTDSCIDLIFTNTPDKIGPAHAQVRGSSDHRIVFVTKHAKNIKQNIRYVKKRSYKNFNEQEFRTAVKNIKWYEVYSCQDVDLAVDIFTGKLTKILDRMAPVKKFQVRTKYAAWVSDSTKENIKERDAAQLTAATTQLKEDWDKYKRLRNDLSVVKKKEKLEWQKLKLEACEESGDYGKLWKNILGWLNWSSASSPTKLSHNGNLETSPSKMAELQNQYYIDKVKSIRQNMPAQQRDPLSTLRQRMQGQSSTFSPDPVSPDQVSKIITSLKNSKASGIDMVDTYVLKLVKDDIVPAVCHIVNLSIQTNRFPTKWKIAKIIPLYKGKGCKLDPQN